MSLSSLLRVGIGGGIGAMLRALVIASFVASGWSEWMGVMAVNLLGCGICGAIAGAWLDRTHAGGWRWRDDRANAELLLVGGFCGGLTTMSALSADVAGLWERGLHGALLADLSAHAVGGLLAVSAGFLLARRARARRYCTP